jgi:cysteine desulfurase
VEESLAHSAIRFGLGRHTTVEEIDTVIEAVVEKVERLRALSPRALKAGRRA